MVYVKLLEIVTHFRSVEDQDGLDAQFWNHVLPTELFFFWILHYNNCTLYSLVKVKHLVVHYASFKICKECGVIANGWPLFGDDFQFMNKLFTSKDTIISSAPMDKFFYLFRKFYGVFEF